MFKNLKWLRITPDRPGRGGTKTGIHSFPQQPVNDTRYVAGCHVYQGAWRRDFDPILYPNPQINEANSSQPLALHGYVYPSLTDPAAQPSVTVLSQHAVPGAEHIWDFNSGTVRASRPATDQPAVFQNISGRCFIGDGKAEGLILDDRTPAIHAQKNQNLGIGTPTQPLGDYFGNLSPYGTGYLYNGSRFVTHPNPANKIGTIKATDVVSFSTLNTSYGQYSGVPIVQASPVADAVTSNTTTFTATGTISITTGTSLVTLSGATWPANFAYCGLSINFNGYSFVIAEHGVNATAFTIDGTGIALSNVQLLILGVYNGPTLLNVPYTITGCRFEMPGGNPASTLALTNTGALGYSQTTASNLVQIQILALQGGLFRNLGNISLGPPLTDEAATGVIQYVTDASMPDNRRRLSSASNPFADTDIGAPIAVDGANPSGGVLITTIATFISAGSVLLGVPNQSGGTIGPVNAWWGADPVINDGAMGAGSSTLTSASNPFIPGDVGHTIVVENAGDVGGTVALITTIATYVNPGQITVTASRIGFPAITNSRVWWRGISTATHAGPTYSYAWYDPETGHMSNIAPLLQVPRPTTIGDYTDFANITPVFQIDPGYISYPSGIDATRFSHLMFFRTLSTPGSSTLYPIGSLTPFIGKVHPGGASTRGSWGPSTYHSWTGLPNNYASIPPNTMGTAPNLWYDFSSDEDLLLSGGFRAPQFTNEKPMVLLRGGATQAGYPYLMAYWDRRLWIVNTQEPTVLIFSCDEAQCPLGIPTESFPPTNRLEMPSVDGRGIGLRTVGDMLLLTTERWAYVIAGNNEANYRLMKVSASMPGVGTYQMDEFPTLTGAEGEPTTLFYLGRDRIVYQWTLGSRAIPISQPIQDQLDSVLSPPVAINPLVFYQLSRVHCVSAWGRRLVLVAPYVLGSFAGQGTGLTTYAYDIDNQVWTTSYRNDASNGTVQGSAPFTTVYGLQIPVNELYSLTVQGANAVAVGSWLRDDVTAAHIPMQISTFPLNFDGLKNRKQIVQVNIHATNNAWVCQIAPNESLTGTIQASFGPYIDPLESIYAAGAVPVEGINTVDVVVMTAQFLSTSAPVVGYRFRITVSLFPPDHDPAELYAIDIGYVDYEEPGEGDA